MKQFILGIESSCDETSVAVYDYSNNKLLANIVSSQISTHTKYGGVMPEIASRLHIEKINYVIKEALYEANIGFEDLSAIAVTSGPGLIGALHVGLQAAKTLAFALNIPLLSVHHLVGHIYANSFEQELKFPCLAVVVSGGHTELVYMKEEYSFEIIGTTQDDAIGEAYDKVARVMGLGYPGGPKIDKASKDGTATYTLPKPHAEGKYNVSYSGLKTAVINLIHNKEQKGEEIRVNDMCASFQERAVGMVVEKVVEAIDEYPVKQVIVAGGVAANSYLRKEIKEKINSKNPNIEVGLPPLWCCGDNAAMIAKAAAYLYKNNKYASLDLGVNPNWSIEDL